jgi:exopolysaccharide biosynthesis polyprenyl glycosylphosphotransferase
MIRLFRVFVPAGSLALLIIEILLITSAFVLAAYIESGVDPTVFLLYDGGLVRVALAVGSVLVGLHFQDLYTQVRVRSRLVLAQQLCLTIGVALILQGLISYLDRNLGVPVQMMAVGSLLSLVAMFIWRVLFSKYALQMVGFSRLLLVGESPVLEEVSKHVEEHPVLGIQIVGHIADDDYPSGATLPVEKISGSLDSLRKIIPATRPDRIVIGKRERQNRALMNELLELRFAGYVIEEAAATYERVFGRICLTELRPSQLIHSGELGPQRQSMLFGMLTSEALAIVGIVMGAPVMLLTAAAVRFSSAGPILYRQTRIGLHGAPFTLYKFRSMRADARVTLVGRTIRKLRIDGLPQLINVLKGEMSIVGPRPQRPEFVQALSEKIPYYRHRHGVRPGMTGWAQVSYKHGDTPEDTVRELEYDLYYIKNMSPSLDIYIIVHTIKAMLLSRGAQ